MSLKFALRLTTENLNRFVGGVEGKGPRDESPLIPSGPEGSSGVRDLSSAAGSSGPSLPSMFIAQRAQVCDSRALRVTVAGRTGMAVFESAALTS